MSTPEFFHNGPGDANEDLFFGVAPFALIDPAVGNVRAYMSMAQEDLDSGGMSKDERVEWGQMECDTMSRQLDKEGILNEGVTVHGRLRIAPWLSEEEIEALRLDPFFLGNLLYEQKDEEGRLFWSIAHDGLVMRAIAMDAAIEGDAGAYVFTFATRSQAWEDDAPEDNEEELYVPGSLIMYSDEMDYIKPDFPSDRYVEQILERDYPDLLVQIKELYPDHERLTDVERIARLAQLKISPGFGMPREVRGDIGRYLYRKLGVDPEIEYVFPMATSYQEPSERDLDDSSDEEHWDDYVCDEGDKPVGAIVDVAVSGPDYDIKLVLWAVDGDDELYRVDASAGEEVIPERYHDEDPVGYDSAFDEMMAGAGIEAPEYSLYPDRIEMPVDEDLAVLREAFSAFYARLEDITSEGGEITPEHTRLLPTLKETIDQLEQMRPGERYVFRGDDVTVGLPIFGCTDKTATVVRIEEFGGTAVVGELMDICGAWFESPLYEKPEYALAAVVRLPGVVFNEGTPEEERRPIKRDVILVRIDDDEVKTCRVIPRNM